MSFLAFSISLLLIYLVAFLGCLRTSCLKLPLPLAPVAVDFSMLLAYIAIDSVRKNSDESHRSS